MAMRFFNYSGQIYAEPHKSYENVKHAGASPISEADLAWACGRNCSDFEQLRVF
jgi:hypothetical protein